MPPTTVDDLEFSQYGWRLRARCKMSLEVSLSERRFRRGRSSKTADRVPVGTLRRFLSENEAGASRSQAQPRLILQRALN